MLILVESKAEKAAAHKTMEDAVTRTLQRVGRRSIGFRGGSSKETIYANGDGSLWAAFSRAEGAKIPRSWNAFGVYDSKLQSQTITVEINIPITENSATVAGFFARDPETGATYLMHDGSVGGGKRGVGRGAFISWSSSELVDVARKAGEPRSGIIIGRVDDPNLSGRVWNFVCTVRAFKDAVKRGELDSDAARAKIAERENFIDEASGHRKGRRRAALDYISYHGDVVRALYDERQARADNGEVVVNSVLIDLMVKIEGRMTEIYEVKTDCGRQSLYTGIGQILVHSVGADRAVRRTLVLPEGDLPEGMEPCLANLGINLRRFRLSRAPNRRVILD